MLENKPVLRERLLGMAAISTILIGGAVGVDTMITSGWQPGGADAHASPVVYATEIPQQYFDDVDRNWNAVPPQQVQLASMTPEPSVQTEDLEGKSGDMMPAVAITPMPPQPLVVDHSALAAQPPERPAPDSQAEADQRFAAIESDIQQATNAIAPDGAPEKTSDEENAWPPS